jgi:hypothetical protein
VFRVWCRRLCLRADPHNCGSRRLQVVVLVMSLCFIGFVTFLHVIGKLYTVRA